MQRAKNPSNIKTHVGVNWDKDVQALSSYLKSTDRCIITDTQGKIGVCLPSYLLSSSFEYDENDIIVFASDDFSAPQDWDEYLINKLSGKQGGLFVRDGYQMPDSSNMLHPAITIPIMTGGCLTALNKAIYHPAYSHMFSDCELYMNVKDLGMLIDDRLADTTTFEHHHYAAGKRNPDQADAAYNKNWATDSATWDSRKNMPLQERLKV
jgi:hypothetical protein